jgi:hypothetical protein
MSINTPTLDPRPDVGDVPEPAVPGDAPSQPLYRIALGRVTSAVILTQRQTRVYTGTLEQLERAYREARTYNLLVGWWGIPFGLVWTPMCLWSNRRAIRELRALAAVQS